jgi:hypothetical protein
MHICAREILSQKLQHTRIIPVIIYATNITHTHTQQPLPYPLTPYNYSPTDFFFFTVYVFNAYALSTYSLHIQLTFSSQTLTFGPCLGRGAFGSVYKALNLQTGQAVAVKQIKLTSIPNTEIDVIMVSGKKE